MINLKVTYDKTIPEHRLHVKDGYADCDVFIRLDPEASTQVKKEVVLHEILECYLPCLNHSRIDDLADLILDGLKQLEKL